MVLCIALFGCSGGKKYPPRTISLKKVHFSKLPGWHKDNHLEALASFQNSCAVLMKKQPRQPVSPLTQLGGRIKDWQRPCNEAMSGIIFTNQLAKMFFERWFTPYQIKDKQKGKEGKFTGYYEIELRGSLKPTKRYKYPVYARPKDLTKLQGRRKIKHQHINSGTLRGKNLEILWVDNLARHFFMQIQGSGVVILPNGREVKLGYDGQNGFSYIPIGGIFNQHCNDRIDSAMDMMDWMHRNPSKGKKIMEKNPSYVFFKVLSEGPVGGAGCCLTPERSLAVDAWLYPYGAPIWVTTSLPRTKSLSGCNYQRLMIAQDTGGAIKGGVRADVFFGRGKRAEELACYMNQPGTYYILFPSSVKVPKKYKSK
jgi:membrane-bound lytic murein transglycosylase A